MSTSAAEQVPVRAHINPHKLLAQSEYFQCPDWAAPAKPGWFLEVVKAGKTIGHYSIDEHPYYLFGRLKTVCDYELEHPTVSRVHLAVVHHRNGSVYAIDLGSQRGTAVNKEPLPKNKPVKVEIGSEIHIADSSRKYLLRYDPDLLDLFQLHGDEKGYAILAEHRRKEEETRANAAASAAARAQQQAAAPKPQSSKWSDIPADLPTPTVSQAAAIPKPVSFALKAKKPAEKPAPAAAPAAESENTPTAAEEAPAKPEEKPALAAAEAAPKEAENKEPAAKRDAEERDATEEPPTKQQRTEETVEKARLSHILLKHTGSKKPTDRSGLPIARTLEQATELLSGFREQLLQEHGAARQHRFAALAKQHSECPSWKKSGDLGLVERGKAQKDFEAAAFALRGGEVSEVVVTEVGVHLIYRVD